MASLINAFHELGGAVADQAGAGLAELRRLDTAQTLQQGQQAFLAGQQANQQGFQHGENEATRASEVNLQKMKSDAAEALARVTDQLVSGREERGRAQAADIANRALTEQQKNWLSIGIPLPGLSYRGGASGGGTIPPASDVGGGVSPTSYIDAGSFTDQNAPSPSRSDAMPPLPSTGNAGGPDLSNPIVRKAFGRPALGSEEDLKYSIRDGLDRDPLWANASDAEKAKETEAQFQVTTNKVGSPEELASMAKGIAKYQFQPEAGRAALGAGGPKLLAMVLKENPKFNATNYDVVKETQKAIVPGGSMFTPISAMETSLGHADHFLKTAQQLGNSSGGNWANFFPNKVAENTGQFPLVNSLKMTAYAMAEEGNRIYAGNAGTQDAINHWYARFPVDGSLADQVGAVKNFAELMKDKFDTVEYHANRVFTMAGLPKAELLSPKGQATYERLVNMGPNGKPLKATPSGTSSTDTLSDPLGIRQ